MVLVNSAGQELLRYRLERAFPVKWQGPDLDASKNEIAIETVELAVERFDRIR